MGCVCMSASASLLFSSRVFSSLLFTCLLFTCLLFSSHTHSHTLTLKPKQTPPPIALVLLLTACCCCRFFSSLLFLCSSVVCVCVCVCCVLGSRRESKLAPFFALPSSCLWCCFFAATLLNRRPEKSESACKSLRICAPTFHFMVLHVCALVFCKGQK